MGWPIHSTQTLKEAVLLITEHCYEKKFNHGKKKERIIQEFWLYIDPTVTQGDLGKTIAEARRQLGLETPKEEKV